MNIGTYLGLQVMFYYFFYYFFCTHIDHAIMQYPTLKYYLHRMALVGAKYGRAVNVPTCLTAEGGWILPCFDDVTRVLMVYKADLSATKRYIESIGPIWQLIPRTSCSSTDLVRS